MKVSFGTADAALHLGPPTEKEREAMEAFANGDTDQAERIIDRIVIEDPSRIRYIHLAVVPPERSLLWMKYCDLFKKMENTGSLLSRKPSSNLLAQNLQTPPSYEEAVRSEKKKDSLYDEELVELERGTSNSSTTANLQTSGNNQQPDVGLRKRLIPKQA